MARRRVFRTKLQGPDTGMDFVRTAKRSALVGRILTSKMVDSEIHVCMDGVVLGDLDNVVSPQVAAAIRSGSVVHRTKGLTSIQCNLWILDWYALLANVEVLDFTSENLTQAGCSQLKTLEDAIAAATAVTFVAKADRDRATKDIRTRICTLLPWGRRVMKNAVQWPQLRRISECIIANGRNNEAQRYDSSGRGPSVRRSLQSAR